MSFDDHSPSRCEGGRRVDRSEARDEALDYLVGGLGIGHTRVVMSERDAVSYFERFETLFEGLRSHYHDLELGEPEYPVSHGVGIIATRRAGVLWIVEGD